MAGIQIRPLITYEPGCLRLGRHRRVFRRSAALLPPAQRAILADAPRAARRRVCEGLRHGGMHHTGMAASRFSAQSFCISAGTTDQHWLTLVIAGPAIAVLSITTILLVYDAHLESRTRKHNEQLEKANAQLEHPATHDSLTGLPNRVLLAERLAQATAQSEPYSRGFAVLVVDWTASNQSAIRSGTWPATIC
jgi:diguanylate cyclase